MGSTNRRELGVTMTVSSLTFPVDRRAHEIKLLVDLVRLSRVTLLYAEEGANKHGVLRSAVMPPVEAARGSRQTEVAVFFDTWDEEPLRALLARIRDAVRATGTLPMLNDDTNGSSLVERLTAWQETLGVTFLIVFDRFENYLALPLDQRSVREFDEEFVAVMNKPSLPANFLLALDPNAAPLLDRLRDRVPALGNASVRLPAAGEVIPDALATFVEHENLVPHTAELPQPEQGTAQPDPAKYSEKPLTHDLAPSSAPAMPEETLEAIALPSLPQATVVPDTTPPPERLSDVVPVDNASVPLPPPSAVMPGALETPVENEQSVPDSVPLSEPEPSTAQPDPAQSAEKPLAHELAQGNEPEKLAAPDEKIETIALPPLPQAALQPEPVAAPDSTPLIDRLSDVVPASDNASVSLPLPSAVMPGALETPVEHKKWVPHTAEPSKPEQSTTRPDRAMVAEKPLAREQPKDRDWAKPWKLEETAKAVARPPVLPQGARRRSTDPRKRSSRTLVAWLTIAVILAALSYIMLPEIWQYATPARDTTPSAAQPSRPISQEPAKPGLKKPTAEEATRAVPPKASPQKPQQTNPTPDGSLSQDKGLIQAQPPAEGPHASLPVNAVDTAAAPQPLRTPPSNIAAREPIVATPGSSASSDTPDAPALHIYVRNEAQRARAQKLVRPLAERGIRVRGIEIVTFGPNVSDLRYFRSEEQDEATRVAQALRSLGLPAQQLKRIPDFETRTALRQYELWLPPQLPDPPV